MLRQSAASLSGAWQAGQARFRSAAALSTRPASSSSGLPTPPPEEPSGLPAMPSPNEESRTPADKGRSHTIALRKRNELRQLEHLPSQKKAQVIEHGVPTYHFSARSLPGPTSAANHRFWAEPCPSLSPRRPAQRLLQRAQSGARDLAADDRARNQPQERPADARQDARPRLHRRLAIQRAHLCPDPSGAPRFPARLTDCLRWSILAANLRLLL